MAEFLQRRRLPDDVLEYLLIPQLPKELEDNEVVPYLEGLCDTYLGYIGPLVIDYIWQNEGFTLRPVTEQGDTPPHLCGRTNFGDNIEDEWFIVYLLYELSRNFPDLVIRASDNDEEFMLIEAADHLPMWLNPETAEKRVYIHGGKLHVVPIPQKPGEVSTFPLFTPTIEEAATLVRNPSLDTCASQPIQQSLSKRLDSCLTKRKENSHYANLYVPIRVAALLNEKPALVSVAVQAFYYRDPIELKTCRTMNHFKPENMVVSRVRFTRCLYAQLLQQNFKPDKRSGWVLPSSSNPKFKEHDLGMKLAHGFEILCARCSSSSSSNGNAEAHDSSGVSEVRWSRFLKSLQEKGYFKGQLEGSQLYNKLLSDAKAFFHSQLTEPEREDSDIAREIVNKLPQLSLDVEPWKQLEKTLPPSDDDSWLDLTPEALDEMMREAAGHHSNVDDVEGSNLQKVAESMNAFVNKKSTVDGVEFPDVSKNKGKESREKEKEEGEGDGEFDGTSFIHSMQKMFEFKDDECSSSDMSEYDWEDNSDDERTPGTRPVAPQPAVFKPPASRPTSKPPARPSKPPALPPKPPSRPSKPPTKRKDPEIEAIMEAMDRELAQTDVGKSFEREPPRPRPPRFQPKPKEQNHVSNPTAQPPPPPPPSQRPSSSSGPSKLVSRPPSKPAASRPSRPPPPVPRKGQPTNSTPTKSSNVAIEDEDDDFRPVNIDVNVVKNTLESLRAQQGLPGPATNILHNMGIVLPPNDDQPAH